MILFHVLLIPFSSHLIYTTRKMRYTNCRAPRNPKTPRSRSGWRRSLSLRFTIVEVSHNESRLCSSAFCGCNVFKTNSHTRCWIISKWATSKCSTLEKHVMRWACFLFFFSCFSYAVLHASSAPLSLYSLQLKTSLPWLQSGVRASPPGTTLTPYPNTSIRWWMWVSYSARNSAFHFLITRSPKAEATPAL